MTGGPGMDGLLNCYVDWRETAAVVAAAYALWCDTPREKQEQHYWGYRAALERGRAQPPLCGRGQG